MKGTSGKNLEQRIVFGTQKLPVPSSQRSHQLYDHALIKTDDVSNFTSTAFFFISLGRPICKELRQRTHSINSSRSQLRRQQFEANIHVSDPMD